VRAAGNGCTGLVYVVAALALLHFFWMRAGKNDFS
jgi:DMSO/TMAO reductase YedYZ heme-binding membrane subunit